MNRVPSHTAACFAASAFREGNLRQPAEPPCFLLHHANSILGCRDVLRRHHQSCPAIDSFSADINQDVSRNANLCSVCNQQKHNGDCTSRKISTPPTERFSFDAAQRQKSSMQAHTTPLPSPPTEPSPMTSNDKARHASPNTEYDTIVVGGSLHQDVPPVSYPPSQGAQATDASTSDQVHTGNQSSQINVAPEGQEWQSLQIDSSQPLDQLASVQSIPGRNESLPESDTYSNAYCDPPKPQTNRGRYVTTAW